MQGVPASIYWRDFAHTDEAVERMPRKGGFWIVVVAIGAAGALLLVAAAEWLSGVLQGLADGFGTALVVAAVLAGTVDYYLKRGLLQDAWKQLFGYLLPGEVREELGWISAQELVCEEYELRLFLEPTDMPDLLRVRMEYRAVIHNVTRHQVPYRPLFALDEWFHPGHPSHVTELRCTRGDRTYKDTERIGDGFSVGLALPEMRLGGDERATTFGAGQEFRHRSDAYFMNLVLLTVNPRIAVDAPEDLEWSVMFGQRHAGELREIGPNRRELPGTLLPHQVIQVRWWPKGAA